MAAIEGYASHTSVVAGDYIDFHVRADTAHRNFAMQIFRRGRQDVLVKTVTGAAFVPSRKQNDAALAVTGCAWPAAIAARTVIPPEWRSGYYVARLTSGNASTGIPFLVRSATPGATSRILLKMSDTTVQAYNHWGGSSLYAGFSPHISFDRPYESVFNFEKYTRPLLSWAEANGFELDYCSSLDLHTNPRILESYRLLISSGHDEYYSLEMRDQAEEFVAGGGNVCFFSGNTCYWQIRLDLSPGRRIMTCFKGPNDGKSPDPEQNDPRRVTYRFYEAPISRPENILTGVSFRTGAGWFKENDPPTPDRYRGYTVTDAAHWVYAGSGLSNGDVFGKGTTVDDTIIGYETDAAEIVAGSSPPVVSGADGTPRDFHVLATADLRDWHAHGQGGYATMGLYQRNGTVFTAGTINWAGGLTAAGNAPADAITRNLLRELSKPR